MPILIPFLVLGGLAASASWLGQAPQIPPSFSRAREIIDQVDRLLRGDSSHGIAVMTVVTERWSRSKTLEIWSKGTEKALIRILAPAKEQGIATLRVESDIWNYLPKIDRTIRVPTSMMMSSWMGSHFSNDDLVKESRLVRDYEIELSFEGLRDAVEVYEFQLTPKPDAPVVWGRIDYRIRKQDLMPIWARFYDEDGTVKRRMEFSDYQRRGGRLIPATMRVRPADKPEEYTEIRYQEIQFDIPIPEEMFSLSALRRRR